MQSEDFYPFGATFNSYTRENTVAQNYLYNGKEQINDLGLDWADYGARMYMPEIGRWGVVDPMADNNRKYSPYNYVVNNPLSNIDPDGMDWWGAGADQMAKLVDQNESSSTIFDSQSSGNQNGGSSAQGLNFSNAMTYDRINKTNYTNAIVEDLEKLTGLDLSIDPGTGNLNYKKDSNGNAIVTKMDIPNVGCGIAVGSSTARGDLIKAMSGSQVSINISPNGRSVTPLGGNDIYLSPTQIAGFISGTPSNLNNGTLGFGMTLMHEYLHTGPGGAKTDPSGSFLTGPAVDKENVYRTEMSANPTNTGWSQWGRRIQYEAIPNGTRQYIPFEYYDMNKRGKTVKRSTKLMF